MAMINRYLQTTGIEAAFKEQCHQLLKSPHLPYNPYPSLVRQLRAYVESFTYHSMDDDDILQQLVYQVQNTTIPEIVQPITGESVYGTQNSIEMISPSVLEQYRWLLKNVTPPVARLHQMTGYVNQVVTALLAPATLHGTFYPHPASINFRVEFIIIGPDVNQAVAIFLESVTNDILHMDSSGTHIFLGLTVPVKDPHEKEKWQQHIYPVEMLQNQKPESWEAIYDAMVKHQKISAECLFRLSEGGDIYRRGQKQYCLNFVEIDEKTGTEKGFQFFSDFPFATLYEGIFLQRSYAEAYVNTFLKRLNFFEDAGNFEENLTDARHLDVNCTITFVIDFRENCQKMVASFHSPSQIFEIVPYALTLITADRKSYPDSLTTDLYKMLHSTAADLHHLMQQNRTIQEVIQHLLGVRTRSSSVVNKLFKQYRNSIVELFSRDEISDDIKSVGQVMMRGLTVITGGDTVHVPVNVDRTSDLHGMEEFDIWNHGNEVLNVQSCMRQVGGPQQIAKESVLLTYVVDTHLDDVWSGFLADLLTEGDSKFPKNPFPRLVSTLRQATLSMELRAKTDDQLQQKILHGKVQVDDPTHYICTIPGHSVYGLSSALSALDVTTFEKLLAIAETFRPIDTNRDVDVYKVGMSCAVSGHCTLYGVVDPYMRQIDLHEHCYITGPTGCVGDAFAVYAHLIYEELMTVSGNQDNVILGVYMGREESLWSIASVKERKRGFVAELEHRFMAREPVYWKLFVWNEWRYIPVVKHLRLHYWNTELTE
ncbi:hypothetical protein NP493_239g03014 [Ridgeia piscesae]|uniref:Uncharacterized protein n=1 Tax=Ridgeia piscesae TaxID=27915 RepID=A0AAD9NZJ5_RIDPI|nr:hypothetical protein NP493_239g03014 [Ridgeia piscesae]